jgi:beta-phosphoglucomutase-like phosphatase (HAD superfamily)
MNRVSCAAKLAFKKVTHVIFDLDGLLLDTETIYKRVFSDIAKSHGKVYTPEIRAKVIGRVEEESAKVAVTEMNLPMSPEKFLQQYKSMAEQSLADVRVMPGRGAQISSLVRRQAPRERRNHSDGRLQVPSDSSSTSTRSRSPWRWPRRPDKTRMT